MICPSEVPTCAADALCPACLDAALFGARRQAATVGACWAERVCRGEHRARDAWPDDERTRAIAGRLVAALAVDPRMAGELVEACMRGAAAWWAGRPQRYRE